VAVLEPIEEGLLALDGEGRPSYANRRLWEMLGTPSRSVQSMTAAEMLGEEAGRCFTAAVRAAVADGRMRSLWSGSSLATTAQSCPSLAPCARSSPAGCGWVGSLLFGISRQQRMAESSGRVLAERLEFLFREMPLAV
jgi:hypothetical protein